MTQPERAQKRLQHLRTLWTGHRPDGTRYQGAQGLTHEEHQEFTNLLIEEVERLKKDYDGCRWHVDRVATDSLAYKKERDELQALVIEARDKHVASNRTDWLKRVDEAIGNKS